MRDLREPARSVEPGTVPRPAVALAAVLGLGTWSGSLFAGEVLLPGGLLLALAPLAMAGGVRAARPLLRGTWPWWLLLALVAAVRAERVHAPSRDRADTGTTAEDVQVGRWLPLDRSGAIGRLVGADANVVLALDGAPPRAGASLVVLPGDPVVPLPRGPVPGPRARGGDAGRRRVRADAWLYADAVGPRAPAAAPALPESSAEARAADPPRARDHDRSSAAALAAAFASAVRGTVDDVRGATRARLATLDQYGAPAWLARALVLGESTAVPYEVDDLTRRTGVRHLFAVSGMHVGVVGLLLIAPLARRLGRAAACAALVAFVLLAGGGTPVVRAGAAAGLALLAPGSGRASPGLGPRRVDAVTLWSLALSLELLAEPRGLGAVGLQLSYLATAGILVGARPMARALRAHAARVAARGAPAAALALRRGWLAVLVGRAGAYGATLLAASLAATLATAPVAWATFGELAPIGLLLTPVALVPVALALLVGLTAALVPVEPAALLLRLAADTLVGLLTVADRLPGTPWALPERPAFVLALVALAGLAWLSARSDVRAASFPRRGSLAGLALLLSPWAPSPVGFELHVLDSGHGTCVLARAPGLPALVFDAGSRDRTALYREAIAPLLARWDARGPVVVLSHDHRDHQGALGALVSRYPPSLWGGVESAHVPLPSSTPRLTLERGRARLPLPRTGPVRATLVRGLDGDGNEGSVGLELTLAAPRGEAPRRLLLLGDAEGEGLAACLRDRTLPRHVDVLLAPHHGSDTDLLPALLERTRPRTVWVPSTARPPIADELERRGLPWASPALAGPCTYRYPARRGRDG